MNEEGKYLFLSSTLCQFAGEQHVLSVQYCHCDASELQVKCKKAFFCTKRTHEPNVYIALSAHYQVVYSSSTTQVLNLSTGICGHRYLVLKSKYGIIYGI